MEFFLSEYDYSLDYIRGEDKKVADALSRVVSVVMEENTDLVIQLSPGVVNVLISQLSVREARCGN